jgi:hypothetical protein
MNTANALGFLLLGTAMQVLPLLSGGSPAGPATAQTLWLQVMSVVTGAIGGGYLMRVGLAEAVIAFSRMAERRAELREQAAQENAQPMPVGVRVTF